MLIFLKKIKYALMGSKFQPIAKICYDSLIFIELTLQRFIDLFVPSIQSEHSNLLNELTVVIKTFERKKTLARLLRSIKRYYPAIQIIVIDDSLNPEKITGVQKINIPYNSGISVGRNEALKYIATKYALFLDDDFVFFRKTKLVDSLQKIVSNEKIDILGGKVVDLPFYITHDYSKIGLYPTNSQPVIPIGSKVAGLPVYEKVANFFICRTDRIKKVGWDPQLKKLEHADFFTRAKGVLLTVYNEHLVCLHAPTPFDKEYMKLRNDCSIERFILKKKYFNDNK